VPTQSRDRAGSHRGRFVVPLLLILALAAVFALQKAFFPPPMSPFQDRREMMDTWVSITVYDRNAKLAESAIDAAFSRMAQVEHEASIFDEQAEAYRLNRDGRLDNPSDDLWAIISDAITQYKATNGVFDITVEPLLDLWRYKEGASVQFWELSPDTQKQEIAQAMTLLGADRVQMITSPMRSIVLPPGMKITLGGIAKGYAVDRGLDVLREQGIKYALINAGGDIGAYGGKPNDEEWELALRNPADENSSLVTFAVTDGAIATSGNYERFFDPEAKVGHIMDPRTGFSSHASSSASVYALTCTQADALATAVFVLGPVDGMDLVNSLDSVEALIVSYDDPQSIFRSSGIDTYIDKEKGGQ